MFYLSQSELLLHLFLTASLFGVIWVFQLIYYPSLRYIDENQWQEFFQRQMSSSSWLLAPLMICELGIAAWLAGKNGFANMYAVPLGLLLLIWLSTFFIQLPILQKLGAAKNEALISRLIQSNWIRTLLWSLKLVWVSWIAYSIWG